MLAALAAAVIGALSLRTSGMHFIMITLAFAQMLYYFFVSLEAYGGDDGISLFLRRGRDAGHGVLGHHRPGGLSRPVVELLEDADDRKALEALGYSSREGREAARAAVAALELPARN